MISLTCVLLLRVALLPGALTRIDRWLRIATPGEQSCRSLSLEPAGGREGTCTRWSSRFTTPTVFTVVNRGHWMRMPEYGVRLHGSEIRATRVTNNPSEYPGGQGELVSFEVTVTNLTSATLDFGAGAGGPARPHFSSQGTVELILPEPGGPYPEVGYVPLLNGNDAPSPEALGPIPPQAQRTGWITFVTQPSVFQRISLPSARIDFLRVGALPGYTGQIRL